MKGLPTLGLLHREAKLQLCVARNAKLQLCWPSSSSLFLKTSLFSTFLWKTEQSWKKRKKVVKRCNFAFFEKKRGCEKIFFRVKSWTFFTKKSFSDPLFYSKNAKLHLFTKKLQKAFLGKLFVIFRPPRGLTKFCQTLFAPFTDFSE